MAWKKFGNVRVHYAGIWFDSKLEKAVYTKLSDLEKAGEITNLRHHPGTVFLSEARVQFRPDFNFTRISSGATEWAEAKGFITSAYRLKEKLWRQYGPGILHVYKGNYSYPKLTETIVPQRGSDVSSGGKGDLHKKRKSKPKAKE